ncbi:YciI family protein [Amycolatopsis benzoatilytica]|uniref:YciI family protein n=1 Tax=Amycolatopsis benzoatilytica TaxID=346045 RepID=UPI00037135B0|nr:YciI family protein [Amycolatopsis benzoatilytica]
MFVVVLTYTAPLDEIDQAMPDHVEWLSKQYDDGHFLASGRQNPRIGGVIITRPMDRANLDAILAADPFAIKGLASYEIIEFSPTRTAPELGLVNEILDNS